MFLQPDWWEVMQAGVGTNRYGYSANDPINGKDPTGHFLTQSSTHCGNCNAADNGKKKNKPQSVGSKIDKYAVGDPSYALEKISKNRRAIKRSSLRWGIDPLGLGSIIFQEKYQGNFALGENIASMALDLVGTGSYTPSKYRSYGLTETQLEMVQEYANETGIGKLTLGDAYHFVQNDANSIDVAAWNAAKNQAALGEPLVGSQAGYLHNLGIDLYKEQRNGYPVDTHVPDRSVDFQHAISSALDGKLEPFHDWFSEHPEVCGGNTCVGN